VTEPVNAERPGWYRYCQDRQTRRQNLVEAADRVAREAAPDPISREKAGYAASRAAVAEFDLAEPELGYDDWRAAA
jgi:hypothetical protein